MQLWSGVLSTYSTKVRIVCGEKGVEVTIRELPWNRQTLFSKLPEFLAVSPRGEVPVLVDGDLVLYDSTVIDEYLEEKFPQPALMPRGLVARARCRLLEDQADYMIAAHHTTLVREVFHKPDGTGRDQAAVGKALAAFGTYHAMLDATLAEQPHLCGDFSVADIATCVAIRFSRALGASIGNDHARLAAWMERVGERPTIKREFDAIVRAVAQA